VSRWDSDLDDDAEVLSEIGKGQRRVLLLALGTVGMVVASALVLTLLLRQPDALRASEPRLAAAVTLPAKPKPVQNLLTYRADRAGHFVIGAMVNGTPVRFLLDTGATMVALSPADARAAGISLTASRFTGRSSTAHGEARVAPVTLRQLRLDQLTIDEVAAVVMEDEMPISLLGMSFLNRLGGYSIRDGVLTIEW
jgi:aspartyl protease family protein